VWIAHPTPDTVPEKEETMPRGKIPVLKRFCDKVQKSETCWLWTGRLNNDGYGRMGAAVGRHAVYAHRIAWELHNGKIPDDMCILHHCDNPPCVRPDHLFLGTRRDNLADMRTKGRARVYDRHGSKNPLAMLVESQVLEIRDKFAQGGITRKKLASEYGVGRPAIDRIINRKNWRHI